MKLEMKTFLKQTASLITALATGAGIFWGGFSLGDKWSGVNRNNLLITVNEQSKQILDLNEKIILLEKDKPELQEIYDLIKREKITYLGNSSVSNNYKKERFLAISKNNSSDWKNGIFFTFSNVNATIESTKYSINICGINFENKNIELETGQSFLIMLDGKKYVFILNYINSDGKTLTFNIYSEK